MATVTGAWLLNDTLTFSITTGLESVVATSDGRQISGIQVVEGSKLYYFFEDTVGSTTVYDKGHWGKESYKSLDFGTTEQTVSDNFYAWLTANAVSQDAEEPEDVLYSIHGSTLTGIADQVRRISGVDGELTPEQMTTNLLNVTPLGEYPKAEEAEFGAENASVEYGLTLNATPSQTSRSDKMYCTNKFTANEAIAIVGLRIYSANTNSRSLTLWDGNGVAIKTVPYFNPTANQWVEKYFDEPVSIAIGESFIISSSRISYYTYIDIANVGFNGKISFVGGHSDESAEVPSSYSTTTMYGIIDIIIGTVQAELPNDYQITRNTMDDIAEEVQRITGTTEKMTTAQIITALQGVAVQSSE